MNMILPVLGVSSNFSNYNLKLKNKAKEVPFDNNGYEKKLPISEINFTARKEQDETVTKLLKRLEKNETDPSILAELQQLDEAQKEEFVKRYCIHTGFPNLSVVNKKMKNHTISTTLESAITSGTKIVNMGFHSHCSAAVGSAFPGSDLDALSIIVLGTQDEINDFKTELWRRFDPTIVSIRKDYEFPDVYGLDQIYEWTKMLDDMIVEAGLDKKAPKYKKNLKETSDFETALEFNIDLARMIEKCDPEELAKKAPSLKKMIIDYKEKPKNVTQSMSSLLESIRSGNRLLKEKLSPEDAKKMERIEQSYLYKYGNMCIQDADFGIKQKLLDRQEFFSNKGFDKLSTDEKFDFILRLIYESYPTWSKAKVDAHFAPQFDNMFDNGKGVDAARKSAFNAAVDC